MPRGSPRPLPYFFAHYFLFLFTLVVILIGVFCSFIQKIKSFPSNSITSQSTQTPYYFAHITDVHSQHVIKGRTPHLTKCFTKINDVYDPPLIMITGDLCDGSESPSFFTPRRPHIGNWEALKNIFTTTGIQNHQLLLMPGNHDYYGVGKDDSDENYFRKFFLNNGEEREIHVQTAVTPAGPLRLIGIDSMELPFIGAPLGTVPLFRQKALDKLKKVLKENPDQMTILGVHFPPVCMWARESVTDVFNQADMVLNGHFHPSTAYFSIFGEIPSVMGPPLFRKGLFGLVTVDNTGISWTQLDATTSEPEAAAVYPIPIEQITSRAVFNLNDFDVKLLVFGGNIDDDLYIDGISKGKPTRNAKLYSLPLHVEDGKHKLKFGQLEYEFFVGSHSPSKTTFSNYNVNMGKLALGLFITVVLIALIKMLPIYNFLPIKKYLDEYEDYMYGADIEMSWWKHPVFGPLLMLSRARHLPVLLYILFIILAVWPLVLPINFQTMGTDLVTLFVWGGVQGDGHVAVYGMALMIGALYYMMYWNPLLTLATLFYEIDIFYPAAIVEIVLLSIDLLLVVVIYIVASNAMDGVFSIFASFGFWIVLIGLVLVILKLVWDRKDRSWSSKSESPTNNQDKLSLD